MFFMLILFFLFLVAPVEQFAADISMVGGEDMEVGALLAAEGSRDFLSFRDVPGDESSVEDSGLEELDEELVLMDAERPRFGSVVDDSVEDLRRTLSTVTLDRMLASRSAGSALSLPLGSPRGSSRSRLTPASSSFGSATLSPSRETSSVFGASTFSWAGFGGVSEFPPRSVSALHPLLGSPRAGLSMVAEVMEEDKRPRRRREKRGREGEPETQFAVEDYRAGKRVARR